MAFDIQTIYDKGKDKNIPWDTLQALIDNGGSGGGSGDEDGSTYRIDCEIEIAGDEILSTSSTFDEIKRAYDNGSVPYCYVTENKSNSNQNSFNYYKLDLEAYLELKSVEPNVKAFIFSNSFIHADSTGKNYLTNLAITFSNNADPQLSTNINSWNGTPEDPEE